MWIRNWIRSLPIVALAALIVVTLATGCGGGSSSSGDAPPPDDSGTPPGAFSKEEAAAFVTAMFRDSGDWGEMVEDAQESPIPPSDLEDDMFAIARASSGSISDAIRETTRIGIQSSWSADCHSGSMSVTERANGYDAVYNACTIESPFFSMYMDGNVSYSIDDQVSVYTHVARVDYEHFTLRMSSGDGDEIDLSMDGSIIAHTDDPSSGEGLVELDLTMEMAADCDGATQHGVWELDYSMHVRPVGNDIFELEINGTMTGAGITTTVETLETVRIEKDKEHPHDGQVRVTYGGSTTTVKYEGDGLWIDNDYYGWAQFKAQYMDEQFDQDACVMSAA